MAVNGASGTLQNVGDIVGPVYLKDGGVGEPTQLTATISLAGNFTNFSIAFDGLPLGQPVVLGTGGLPTTPLNATEWIPVLISPTTFFGWEQNLAALTLSSTGKAGSGYIFQATVGHFLQVRLRLVATGGGLCQAAIAVQPQLPYYKQPLQMSDF
jgi:hypothetical protein